MKFEPRLRREISLKAKYALFAFALSSKGGEARDPLNKLWPTILTEGSSVRYRAVIDDLREVAGVLKLLIESKKLL